ncbi:MAG: sigma-54-dependent Fis family transcriptional regulator [Magnetococcales bacterium]|nr:sigma-54-dependent Fis family transcriptional regulator [Magnetococcales bacterium]
MTQDTHPVIIVDDEQDILLGSSYLLKSGGIRPVVTLDDPTKLIPLLEQEAASVIVLDLLMPQLSGQELLPQIVERFPHLPVIIMTALQDVETAVDCMQNGAFDYLVKPVEESRFLSSVRRALEVRTLRRQIDTLRDAFLGNRLRQPEVFSPIVTRSTSMRAIFQYVEAVAASSEPILVTGETGTGKELIVQAIHQLSRPESPLVSLNVAGLDDTMISDALFGHVKGAFSGAERPREGLVASAAGGTLYLDEIGELSPASQVKLLRLIQDHTYYPLGSDVNRLSRARIIASTNRDLQRSMQESAFRTDLYYRLASHPITLPPLRDRQEDVHPLLLFFVEEAALSMEKPVPRIPDELPVLLMTYHFPGNVRELRAMVYNGVAQHQSGSTLSMESFREAIRQSRGSEETSLPEEGETHGAQTPSLAILGPFPTLKEADRFLIDEAMRRAEDNQGIAATLLGITRQSLNRRLKTMKKSATKPTP